MPMSLFYSSPPLLPPPPPRAIFFDIDSAILEAGHYYIRNSLSTGNITAGPMPSPLATPHATAGSRKLPAPNSPFLAPRLLNSCYRASFILLPAIDHNRRNRSQNCHGIFCARFAMACSQTNLTPELDHICAESRQYATLSCHRVGTKIRDC